MQTGIPMHYVRGQLGHLSIKVTVDIYGHIIPGANKGIVDILDTISEKETLKHQFNAALSSCNPRTPKGFLHSEAAPWIIVLCAVPALVGWDSFATNGKAAISLKTNLYKSGLVCCDSRISSVTRSSPVSVPCLQNC